MEKVCKICGTKETTKWFSGPMCRKCYRAQPHIKAGERRCYEKNSDHYREYYREFNARPEQKAAKKKWNAEYYTATKEQQLEKTRRYRAVNKDSVNRYANEYQKMRRQQDPNFQLRCSLRSRLSHALKGKMKLGSHIKLLGCTVDELRLRLESLFLPGMTWDNYTLKGWHIDHIRPLSSFDLSDPEQLKAACHYTNLQPLWATDNLSKGDHYA